MAAKMHIVSLAYTRLHTLYTRLHTKYTRLHTVTHGYPRLHTLYARLHTKYTQLHTVTHDYTRRVYFFTHGYTRCYTRLHMQHFTHRYIRLHAATHALKQVPCLGPWSWPDVPISGSDLGTWGNSFQAGKEIHLLFEVNQTTCIAGIHPLGPN